MSLTEKHPDVNIAQEARFFARICAARGGKGCAVLTCYNGHVSSLTYGGETYVRIKGEWFAVGGANDAK